MTAISASRGESPRASIRSRGTDSNIASPLSAGLKSWMAALMETMFQAR